MELYKNYLTPTHKHDLPIPMGDVTHLNMDQLVFLGDYNVRGSLKDTSLTVTQEYLDEMEMWGIKTPLPITRLGALNNEGKPMFLALDGQRRGIAVDALIKLGKEIRGIPADMYRLPVTLHRVNPYDMIEVDAHQMIFNSHIEHSVESHLRIIKKHQEAGRQPTEIGKLLKLSPQRVARYMKLTKNPEALNLVNEGRLSVNAGTVLAEESQKSGLDTNTLFNKANENAGGKSDCKQYKTSSTSP